jgi:HD-like signal output (HDOD) protein
MSVIDSIISTKELVTLPAVATSVLRLLENDNSDLKDIVRIVQTDPSLSIKILKISNSPLYATKREITSIQQAIMLIGFNKLINVVLGVSIFSKFWLSTKPGAEELMNKFWWHSCSVGTIAKFIAFKMKKSFNENEFIGGLLHKIGKLVMIQYDIDKYQEVIRLVSEENISDIEAEEKVFGANHVQVGAQLSKIWKLPDEVSTIITNYTIPAQAGNQLELVSVVNLSSIICELNDAPFFMGLPSDDLTSFESWNYLNEVSPVLKDGGPETVTSGLKEEFQKSADFLNNIRV